MSPHMFGSRDLVKADPVRLRRLQKMKGNERKMIKPPIDRFLEWSKGEGKEYLQKQCDRYGRCWVQDQWRTMCHWVEDNPVKGNKKNWKAFVRNWLIREYQKRSIEMEKAINPATMTKADEGRQEQKQRESIPRLGDILQGK